MGNYSYRAINENDMKNSIISEEKLGDIKCKNSESETDLFSFLEKR